jgi:hypothetical protein
MSSDDPRAFFAEHGWRVVRGARRATPRGRSSPSTAGGSSAVPLPREREAAADAIGAPRRTFRPTTRAISSTPRFRSRIARRNEPDRGLPDFPES